MGKRIDGQRIFKDITEKQGKGIFIELIRVGLYLLSGIYYLVLKCILCFYRCGLRRKRKLSAYTISVGNITVGGTGKTPVVIMLTEKLRNNGRRVAVLSRGYKRVHSSPSITGNNPGIVSDGVKMLMGVREAGDEPYLLARNLPGTAVIVDKDRVVSGNYAIDNFAVDTLVLDDGYQYKPLSRDLDIVVIDSLNPFGNGHLLPRGRLREPLSHLKRGNVFILTHVDLAVEDDLANLKKILNQLNPNTGIIETIHKPECLINLRTREKHDLAILDGKKILALSSIGHPESFEITLERLGAVLTDKINFPDHHWYRQSELSEVEEKTQQQGAEFIVTTEKDAVRIGHRQLPLVDVFYLKIKLEIVTSPKGQDFMEELLLCQRK